MGARHTLRYGLNMRGTAGALLVVLVTLWAALTWAPQHSQLAIGGAVTVVGAIALRRRAHDKHIAGELMILTALAGIGVVASQFAWAFIPLALAVGLGAGLMWTLGSVAGLIGVAVIATILATARIPATLGSALTTAGFVFAGGLLQIAITSPHLRSHVRTAVAAACGSRPRRRVRSQIRWASATFRHALRLAAGCGAALLLLAIRDVPEGIWIPLTVALVLRPGPAQNALRYAERISGAAAGVVVASAISFVWSLSPEVSSIAVALCLVVAFLSNGWPRIGAVSSAIAFAMDASQTLDAAMFSDRVYALGIGAAIAVWMFVLLPDHVSAKASYRVGELLRAELAFAATKINAYVRPASSAGPTRRAAHDRAMAASTAFDRYAASFDSAARTDAHALSVAVAALDTERPRSSDEICPPLIAAADEYVAALRGCQTPCHPEWHLDVRRLDAADVALRSATGNDQALGTYVGAITKHARSIDAILAGDAR